MNENVGASFGLSVLIVVFFAVVLYQPETPQPPVAAVPPTATAEPVEARPPEALPAPKVVVRPAARSDPQRVEVVSRPVSRPSPRRNPSREPRGTFTKARDGETLADVARRVYGDDNALKTLWAANRDLLDRVDDPVVAGSILRTP